MALLRAEHYFQKRAECLVFVHQYPTDPASDCANRKAMELTSAVAFTVCVGSLSLVKVMTGCVACGEGRCDYYFDIVQHLPVLPAADIPDIES